MSDCTPRERANRFLMEYAPGEIGSRGIEAFEAERGPHHCLLTLRNMVEAAIAAAIAAERARILDALHEERQLLECWTDYDPDANVSHAYGCICRMASALGFSAAEVRRE